MSLIVQKFGGTSVADSQKIMAAARRAIRAKQAGHAVIVVVSARGQTTDELIGLAHEISEQPPAREMDVLLSTGEQISVALMAMALETLGHPAISFTGSQIGLVTDSLHTKARIKAIGTERMQQALEAGRIVIVAGFQGVDEKANITTLGRGGSDTTAVALAAVMHAESCEIYTDVEGVYTTDPRIVPEARKIAEISYEEMLELASLGAGVMHSRSIEFAQKYRVPIHVRSSFSDASGTWIVPQAQVRGVVCGAALLKDEARITVEGLPDRPGAVHRLFTHLGQRHLVVDMIVQNVGSEGKAEVSFTVPRAELAGALQVMEEIRADLGAAGIRSEEDAAKVSVVGNGMRTHGGVAQRMFAALAAERINIQMITTSEIKISALVGRADGPRALRAVHAAFGLDCEPAARDPDAASSPPLLSKSEAAGARLEARDESLLAAVQQLSAMEDIVVSGVTLDADQAVVTVDAVPDRPGIASRIFSAIAQAGVSVDMIVQNVSRHGSAMLSFTARRADLEPALRATRSAMAELGGRVSAESAICKLSVLGVGVRTHTGVATRMFGALAEAGINIRMINTSEILINVVVDRDRAAAALESLRRTFHLTPAADEAVTSDK